MNVSRRTVIVGGVMGAVAGILGLLGDPFEPYESRIWVENRRATSTTVGLGLANLDSDQTVLDESVTLSSDEDFRREGLLSNETRYRITVRTDDDSTEREFQTCCRGFQVSVYVERDGIQILLGHHE